VTANKKRDILAKLALLAVAIAWGSSLVVVKASTDSVSPNLLLAIRFTVAFILLAAIFHKKLNVINKEYLKSGMIIGFCLFLAYCSQTIGVIFAMPGKSAFLSSSYCVIVPFLFWLIEKVRPSVHNIIAAVLCTFGIIIASVTSDLIVTKGDGLALLSAVLFAAHIVSVSTCGKGKDPIVITILQFGFSAVCSWGAVFFFESPLVLPTESGAIWGVLYLALICTALSLLLQNIGQKYTNPSSASLILSLESVFGVFFSVIFFQEELNLQLVVGFVLIFSAIIVSETKFSYLKKDNRFIKLKSTGFEEKTVK